MTEAALPVTAEPRNAATERENRRVVDAPQPVSANGGRFPLWSLAPFALLGAMVVGWGFLLSLAINDPTFAVEKDYYKKAVRWNDTQEQAGKNAELAYRLTFSALRADGAGLTPVTVSVTDAQGKAVTGAALNVEGIHNADAGRPTYFTLTESGAGRYTGQATLTHLGLWELRVAVKSAKAQYTESVRVEVTR